MRTLDSFAAIARTALAVTIPMVLVISPLYLFVSPTLVRHEYARKSFPSAERFGDGERSRLSNTILHYLRGQESEESMAAMRTDEGGIALRKSEVQHLVDVKVVLDGLFLVHGIAAFIALICLLFLWQPTRRATLSTVLRQGAWITVVLMGVVLIASFVNFDVFFTRFHQVFFQPGTWIFYVQDTLIQLYPLVFWSDVVWKLAVSILLETGLLYVLSILLERSD